MTTRSALLLCALCAHAAHADTILVSRANDGTQANGHSFTPKISADGRWIAFLTAADNLVPTDTNGATDIFISDTSTSQIQIVSADSAGQAGNGASDDAAISSDGRFIAFVSDSTNLAGGTSGIFVLDRDTDHNAIFDEPGLTDIALISVREDGTPFGIGAHLSISTDGRLVAFDTSTQVVASDTNFLLDVYLLDRDSDGNGIFDEPAGYEFTIASSGGNGDSEFASVSADGTVVVFQSNADNFAITDTNASNDAFVFDIATNQIGLISHTDSGSVGNSFSGGARVSRSGRYVAFISDSSNLVDNDFNGTLDVFLLDRNTDLVTLVSANTFGRSGNGLSDQGTPTDDGRFVSFVSSATDLLLGPLGGRLAFVRDVQTGKTYVASVDSQGERAIGGSDMPVISADGAAVTFQSNADNLVENDLNSATDVFRADMSDVVLTIENLADPVFVVENLEYEMTVRNSGVIPATDVGLTIEIPADADLVSADLGGQNCDFSGQLISCTVVEIGPGGSSTGHLVLHANAVGTLEIEGSVTADLPDLDTTNNSALVTTEVLPAVDLSVTLTASASSAQIGDHITYTIAIDNLSPVSATGTVLDAMLGSGMSVQLVSASAGDCEGSGLVASCMLGTLAGGGRIVATITTRAEVGGQSGLTASVRSNDLDPISENDSDSQKTTIVTSPPPGASPTGGGGGGGGSLDPMTLLYLLMMAFLIKRCRLR